jgi:signal transduction histidine kinase/ligand-binding sensor domain-containing protein
MLACLASLLIAQSAVDSTPARPITQLVHTRWTTEDGAPSDVRALAQTRDGYLWVGAVSGLVRFDGVRFAPFTPRAGDTLPPGGVRSLLTARDGSLWIVWLSGRVSRLHDGRLISYGESDGVAPTFRLAESSTGTLVAGTATGLARFAAGKWRDVSREWAYPGTEGQSVWFDHEDALWAETEDRVVYLPSGGHQFLDPGVRLRGAGSQAVFAETKDGTIWMAELSRSAHTLRRVGDQSPSTEVMVGARTLLIDRKGSLWVGSLGDGLRRVLDPSPIRGHRIAQFGPEAEQFTQKDGLLSDLVTALLEDREGNVWVGTFQGLDRFREGAFAPIATPGGVRPRFVFASRDTSVWTGAFNLDGFVRLGPRNQEMVQTRFSPENLAQDSSGVLWSVSEREVLRLEGRRFIPIPLGRSDVRTMVDIAVDPGGHVWVSDQWLGLLRLTPRGLVQVGRLAESGSTQGVLFSDHAGRIWVGQNRRVALYDHGRLTLFAAEQGMGPRGDVHGFFEDRAGHVWVASDDGLSKVEGNRLRILPESQGVPGRSVYGILEDNAGAWWLATPAAVFRVPPGEIDRALADSHCTVRYRRFDRSDGLPGTITLGRAARWLAQAPDGRIWVATDGGVASVDPRHLPRSVAPPVLIEALRIGGRELAPSEANTVPAGTNDLEIHYTATVLSIPERVQFRYRLEGEEQAWRTVGTRRQAYYTGLAPGEHRFRVEASNGDGVWNEARGATWTFRVLPTWYQTLWFRAGVVLMIGGIGAAAAALVQRRRHLLSQAALERQHQATMAERSRIAQDLHDSLLQGFTGITFQLRAIQRRLGERPAEGVAALDDLAGLAETTLRDARHMIWDMRTAEMEGRDLADGFEHATRQVLIGSSVELTFNVSGDRRRLPLDVETTAIRIGREAVLNALKHAAPRTLVVNVDYGRRLLTLTVVDDGKGIAPGAIEAAPAAGHWGIAGMKDRAERARGTLAIGSVPGRGTTVSVSLPVGMALPVSGA